MLCPFVWDRMRMHPLVQVELHDQNGHAPRRCFVVVLLAHETIVCRKHRDSALVRSIHPNMCSVSACSCQTRAAPRPQRSVPICLMSVVLLLGRLPWRPQWSEVDRLLRLVAHSFFRSSVCCSRRVAGHQRWLLNLKWRQLAAILILRRPYPVVSMPGCLLKSGP